MYVYVSYIYVFLKHNFVSIRSMMLSVYRVERSLERGLLEALGNSEANVCCLQP